MEKYRHDGAFRQAIARQAALPGKRVERFEWRGRAVWIKRFHVRDPALGRRLHEMVSRVVPLGFLRASRPADAAQMVLRERRKLAAFRRAGIAVPELVWFDRTSIALSDEGRTLEQMLKGSAEALEDARHAALVRLAARELGRVHRAGLCHGRPHPRDMALRDGRVVFFDFEEEPEAVMPLADAQARDAWLLFLQLTARARSRTATRGALDAYRRAAPARAQSRLRRIARLLWLPARLCASLRIDRMGSDLRRFAGATLFLAAALASPDMPLGPGLDASPTLPIARKSSGDAADDTAGQRGAGGEGPLP